MSKRVLISFALIAVLVALGLWARSALGLEASAESIRAWIIGYGWWGPFFFVVLLTFRHFVLLPSTLMLTVGGAVFGVAVSGPVGALGVLLNALLEFGLFRGVTPPWLAKRTMGGSGRLVSAVRHGTPALVLASTAIPAMPMSLFYWAAAFTPMRVLHFGLYCAIGGVIRSYTLALLGAGLVTADPLQIGIATAAIVGLLLIAALTPGIRNALSMRDVDEVGASADGVASDGA